VSVRAEPGQTLNASLFYSLTSSWIVAGIPVNQAIVAFTLLSEAALLFVAAQAGFLDGPRVLANMAIDRWVPTRFAYLSDRLVTQDGVLMMGAAALAVLLVTRGDVDILVVLYSINVFLTFSLSQLGMVLHWWASRRAEPRWLSKLALNGLGLAFTTTLLVATVGLKFTAGGWVTLIMTSVVIGVCLVVRRHYDRVQRAIRYLEDTLINAAFPPEPHEPAPLDRHEPTAVLMVGGFNGVGVHSLLSITARFPGYFTNVVFVEIGVVDSSRFKGRHEVRHIEKAVQDDLAEYRKLAESFGFHAESRYRLGTDAVHELEELCLEVAKEFSRCTFFAGKLVLKRETFLDRYLHNQTAAKVEQRLHLAGQHTVVLPLVVAA
jgi:hypothetical protein